MEFVIAGIAGPEKGNIKVESIDTPAKQPEPYQINRDAME